MLNNEGSPLDSLKPVGPNKAVDACENPNVIDPLKLAVLYVRSCSRDLQWHICKNGQALVLDTWETC